MKKKFKLEDLDCANCAAKMEDAINKMLAWLDDVSDRRHEQHLMTEYPQTEELYTEVRDIDATF